MFKVCYIVSCVLILLFSNTCFAKEKEKTSTYVNIAVFQVADATETDPLFVGSGSDLLKVMDSKNATVLFLLHSPKMLDGDVINIQSSAFHLKESNKDLQSLGFDCQFNFTNRSDEDSFFYALAGFCSLNVSYHDAIKSRQIMLKRTTLSESLPTTDIWTRVYKDKKTNVLFYVDVDLM